MYDSNGMLYAFKYNGDVFYYVRDALGNINYIVNQDGELESSYTYEAYGSHTVLNAQGSTSTSSTLIGNINPFRYKGYYYDVETYYICPILKVLIYNLNNLKPQPA